MLFNLFCSLSPSLHYVRSQYITNKMRLFAKLEDSSHYHRVITALFGFRACLQFRLLLFCSVENFICCTLSTFHICCITEKLCCEQSKTIKGTCHYTIFFIYGCEESKISKSHSADMNCIC